MLSSCSCEFIELFALRSDGLIGVAPRSASLAVPITIYYVVLNVLPQKLDRVGEANGRVFFTDERYWQARAASVGSFLGLFLLGWVPFFLWKANVSVYLSAIFL